MSVQPAENPPPVKNPTSTYSQKQKNDVKLLRSWWEFAAVSQFLHLHFESLLYDYYANLNNHEIIDFDVLTLEHLMVTLDPWVENFSIKLFRQATRNRFIVKSAWLNYLNVHLANSSLPPLFDYSPQLKYHHLTLRQRVLILHYLCELQLDKLEWFRGLTDVSELECKHWRVDPVGVDGKGDEYWLFDDSRLFKESKKSSKSVSPSRSPTKAGANQPTPKLAASNSPQQRASSPKNQNGSNSPLKNNPNESETGSKSPSNNQLTTQNGALSPSKLNQIKLENGANSPTNNNPISINTAVISSPQRIRSGSASPRNKSPVSTHLSPTLGTEYSNSISNHNNNFITHAESKELNQIAVHPASPQKAGLNIIVKSDMANEDSINNYNDSVSVSFQNINLPTAEGADGEDQPSQSGTVDSFTPDPQDYSRLSDNVLDKPGVGWILMAHDAETWMNLPNGFKKSTNKAEKKLGAFFALTLVPSVLPDLEHQAEIRKWYFDPIVLESKTELRKIQIEEFKQQQKLEEERIKWEQEKKELERIASIMPRLRTRRRASMQGSGSGQQIDETPLDAKALREKRIRDRELRIYNSVAKKGQVADDNEDSVNMDEDGLNAANNGDYYDEDDDIDEPPRKKRTSASSKSKAQKKDKGKKKKKPTPESEEETEEDEEELYLSQSDESPENEPELEPMEPEEQQESWYLDCMCGASGLNVNDGQEVVECESCGKWEHVNCVNPTGSSDWADVQFYCHKCRPSAPGAIQDAIEKAMDKESDVEFSVSYQSDFVADPSE